MIPYLDKRIGSGFVITPGAFSNTATAVPKLNFSSGQRRLNRNFLNSFLCGQIQAVSCTEWLNSCRGQTDRFESGLLCEGCDCGRENRHDRAGQRPLIGHAKDLSSLPWLFVSQKAIPDQSQLIFCFDYLQGADDQWYEDERKPQCRREDHPMAICKAACQAKRNDIEVCSDTRKHAWLNMYVSKTITD